MIAQLSSTNHDRAINGTMNVFAKDLRDGVIGDPKQVVRLW